MSIKTSIKSYEAYKCFTYPTTLIEQEVLPSATWKHISKYLLLNLHISAMKLPLSEPGTKKQKPGNCKKKQT